MKRINVYLYDYHIQFLKRIPQTISETIRIALDEYIEKFNKVNVSSSLSKKGDKN